MYGEKNFFGSLLKGSKKNEGALAPEVVQSIESLKQQVPESLVTSYVINLTVDQQKTLDIILEGIYGEESGQKLTFDSFVSVVNDQQQAEVISQMQILLDSKTQEAAFDVAKERIKEIIDQNTVEPKMFAAL